MTEPIDPAEFNFIEVEEGFEQPEIETTAGTSGPSEMSSEDE